MKTDADFSGFFFLKQSHRLECFSAGVDYETGKKMYQFAPLPVIVIFPPKSNNNIPTLQLSVITISRAKVKN